MLFAEAMAASPEEDAFARVLARLWRETMWLERTGQFPNGLPLHEQFKPELMVYEMFLSAVSRREQYLMDKESESPAPGESEPPVSGEEELH